MSDFLSKPAHLSVTACVVGYRSVCVRRKGYSESGQHAYRGYANAVEPFAYRCRTHGHVESVGTQIAYHYRRRNGKHRYECRDHACSYTFYYYGSRACHRCLGYLPGRLVAVRRVIFCCLSDDDTGYQTAQDRERQSEPVVYFQHVEYDKRCYGSQCGTEIRTVSERVEQILHCRTLLCLHGENAEQREKYTHCGNKHRCDDSLELHVSAHGKGSRAESCGRQNGAAVAFVQVGTHSSHVSHIISHVVGDCSRIARVVLRNVRLHLAHKVGSHVCRLCIDASANAGEQCLRGSTHSEGQHCCGYCYQSHLFTVVHSVKDDKPQRNVEQSESDYHQSHHGTAAECDSQSAVKTAPSCVCRACGGVGGGLHSEKSRKPGEESSGEESERHPRVLHLHDICHEGENSGKNDKHYCDNLVLLFKIRHGTFSYMSGYLTHSYGSLVFLHHVSEEDPRGSQSCYAGGGNEPKYRWNVVHIFSVNDSGKLKQVQNLTSTSTSTML